MRLAVKRWEALRCGRPFPARSDVQPRDLGSLLRHLSLVKVIDGGADFEHRIVGDVVVRAFRVPLQNRRFSEIEKDAPELISASRPMFQETVTLRAPQAWRGLNGNDIPDATFALAELVVLPLGDSDTAVDHLLAFADYSSEVRPVVHRP